MRSVPLQRHSIVRDLLAPRPRDAAEQRRAVRQAAGRVIRAYKRNKPIVEGDAVVCAVSAAQLIDILERAVRHNGEKRQATHDTEATR